MNPPPPILPASGKVTAIANAVATEASTALPPRASGSCPTIDASDEAETTTPLGTLTGAHPSASKQISRRRRRMRELYRAGKPEDTGKPESCQCHPKSLSITPSRADSPDSPDLPCCATG